ncbi:hypothetical protein MANES_01G094950v8 [Manihot esculenta]|uniref:Uncharacterized protein n=1 Tax=Manihot esculenta TaxID=3983 RepID=A0ACB7IDB6_MANES|nr:hypothetical protein MANES_01G094950v8 [Manihot esculenta]
MGLRRGRSMRFFSESVVAVVVLILLSTSHCRAGVSKIMGGNHLSIGETNVESEFVMDSEFSRMLVGSTPAIGNPGNPPPPLTKCRDSVHYCLPPQNLCNARIYDRNCER